MKVLSNTFSCLSQVPIFGNGKNKLATGFLLPVKKHRVEPRLHVGSHTRLGAQPMDMALSLATGPDRDPVVLLQTSALLLFLYWISNFVVPHFVMKRFSKDENPDD